MLESGIFYSTRAGVYRTLGMDFGKVRQNSANSGKIPAKFEQNQRKLGRN
jgi:hypothetical protein